MNELVEIRSTNVAFEMRNGVRVEYANGDREARMRALGCPEAILKRVREKRQARQSLAAAQGAPEAKLQAPSIEELARWQGTTVAKLQAASDAAKDSALRCQARRLARTMESQQDSDLRSQAARLGRVIVADAEQLRKDEMLLDKMQGRAGIVVGKRRL